MGQNLQLKVRLRDKAEDRRAGVSPEFVDKVLDLGAGRVGILRGRASQRGTMPSSVTFNKSFRAACLHACFFLSLEDTRLRCQACRREYNEVSPPRSFSQRPPTELSKALKMGRSGLRSKQRVVAHV